MRGAGTPPREKTVCSPGADAGVVLFVTGEHS
jgi:hypothetical protein